MCRNREQFGFLHFESLQIGQNALQHLPALLQPLLRNISRLRFLTRIIHDGSSRKCGVAKRDGRAEP